MTLFEKILNTNIINFLIVMSTLVWIFKKAHLGDLIQKMADDIKQSVEKSENDTETAIKNYEEVKISIKDTPKLRDEIFQDVKNKLLQFKNQTENDIKIKKDDIYLNLNQSYKTEEEKYKKITNDEVYTASLNLAKDEILKRLDKKMHNKLIQNAILELDNIELSIGGEF